ncbi:MAG: PilZ domain-containing protein [Candidatus Goldiibacteriota bacterium]
MAIGKMFVEKRKHQRVDKGFEISYKLIPKEITDETVKKEGMTKDISIGGVRVEGEMLGTLGDVLRVEINTGVSSDPTVVFAEIRWVDDSSGRFGLEFLALREHDQEILKKIINVDE